MSSGYDSGLNSNMTEENQEIIKNCQNMIKNKQTVNENPKNMLKQARLQKRRELLRRS